MSYAAGSGSISFTQNGGGKNNIVITPSGDFDGTIDDVSVRKIISPGVYGPEMVVNGRFNGGASGWLDKDELPQGWTYTGETGGVLPTYNPSLSSALAVVEQGLPFPKFVFGGVGDADGDTFALFKKDEEYGGFHIFRTNPETQFRDGDVVEIVFGVHPGISGDMEIVVKLYFDNESESSVSNTINAANYPNGDKFITLTAKNFGNSVHFKNNFFIEFQITGADLATITLPISYVVDHPDT